MALRRTWVAALMMIAIASVAGSRSHHIEREESPAALNGRRPVPAAVMSTLRRACFDCHSHETRWPWYASVPIASMLVERDVTAGRGQLDLSRWTEYNPFDRADLLDKMCRLASTARMPPWPYRAMHGEARLSAGDVAALCAWSEEEATHLVEEDR
jgi:Haem-binding domain